MKQLLCLCAALALAPLAIADEAADARKIIDKAIKAIGRTDKDQIKAVTSKIKGTFYGMGAEFPYTGTFSTQFPDKTRMEIENAFVVIVNGNKGSTTAGGQVMEMTEEQVKEHHESLYGDWVAQIVPLTGKEFTLATVGEGKVEDKTCVAVKVSHKGRRDVTLHFDKETGLLARIDQTVKDEQTGGAEQKQETVIKEFATVGTFKVPSKIVVKRDGKMWVDGESSDIKYSDKLPAETFEKP